MVKEVLMKGLKVILLVIQNKMIVKKTKVQEINHPVYQLILILQILKLIKLNLLRMVQLMQQIILFKDGIIKEIKMKILSQL